MKERACNQHQTNTAQVNTHIDKESTSIERAFFAYSALLKDMTLEFLGTSQSVLNCILPNVSFLLANLLHTQSSGSLLFVIGLTTALTVNNYWFYYRPLEKAIQIKHKQKSTPVNKDHAYYLSRMTEKIIQSLICYTALSSFIKLVCQSVGISLTYKASTLAHLCLMGCASYLQNHVLDKNHKIQTLALAGAHNPAPFIPIAKQACIKAIKNIHWLLCLHCLIYLGLSYCGLIPYALLQPATTIASLAIRLSHLICLTTIIGGYIFMQAPKRFMNDVSAVLTSIGNGQALYVYAKYFFSKTQLLNRFTQSLFQSSFFILMGLHINTHYNNSKSAQALIDHHKKNSQQTPQDKRSHVKHTAPPAIPKTWPSY